MSSPLPPSGEQLKSGDATDERFGLLMSIQPRFARAILEGTKTVELRRKPPRDQPEVVIIYGSGTAKAVLGVARLKEVHTSTPDEIWEKFGPTSGVTRAEFEEYFDGSRTASALELTHPRRSGEHVPLSRLREFGLEPPQSWRYVERETAKHLLDALELPSVECLLLGRRSRSWSMSAPTALVDLSHEESTRKLDRPLLPLADTVRFDSPSGVNTGVSASCCWRPWSPRLGGD